MKRAAFRAWCWSAVFCGCMNASTALAAPPKTVKYYFKVVEVTGPVDDETKRLAKAIVEQELAARPEFAQAEPGALEADRGSALRRFDVSLKLGELKTQLKEPRPGSRLKQLAVSSSLGIFGAELPSHKLAFSGEGDASEEAEIVERRLAEETKPIVHDVLVRAIKEAVDQAVHKLGAPAADPGHGKRKKRAG